MKSFGVISTARFQVIESDTRRALSRLLIGPKKIITAYVDKHAAMMIELISEGHFDEFPLPRLSLPDEGADHSDDGGENGKRPLQTTVGKFLFPFGFACGALFGLLLANFILPV